MIRTKHLFLLGILSVLTLGGGGIQHLIAQRIAAAAHVQTAAVVLGVPDVQYPATISSTTKEDARSFLARVRDAYVPPEATTPEASLTMEGGSADVGTMHTFESIPVPIPSTPLPQTQEESPAASSSSMVVTGNGATSSETTD